MTFQTFNDSSIRFELEAAQQRVFESIEASLTHFVSVFEPASDAYRKSIERVYFELSPDGPDELHTALRATRDSASAQQKILQDNVRVLAFCRDQLMLESYRQAGLSAGDLDFYEVFSRVAAGSLKYPHLITEYAASSAEPIKHPCATLANTLSSDHLIRVFEPTDSCVGLLHFGCIEGSNSIDLFTRLDGTRLYVRTLSSAPFFLLPSDRFSLRKYDLHSSAGRTKAREYVRRKLAAFVPI